MNTQLTEDRRTPTVSSSTAVRVIRRSRPPNVLERLALRLGVALIIWGRGRSRSTPDRAELIRRHETQLARERREREYQLNGHLAIVRR